MTIQAAFAPQPTKANGVEVEILEESIRQIGAEPSLAEMTFQARNNWVGGGLNRSSIKDFYGGGEKDETRTVTFTLDADEPLPLAGTDTAPNPVEFVLHALLSCLTTTIVYHAALNGVAIESIESKAEGDLDARGVLAVSDKVRNGFHHVRVKFRVKADATAQTIKEFAGYSPVYDIVSGSVPVDLAVEVS